MTHMQRHAAQDTLSCTNHCVSILTPDSHRLQGSAVASGVMRVSKWHVAHDVGSAYCLSRGNNVGAPCTDARPHAHLLMGLSHQPAPPSSVLAGEEDISNLVNVSRGRCCYSLGSHTRLMQRQRPNRQGSLRSRHQTRVYMRKC